MNKQPEARRTDKNQAEANDNTKYSNVLNYHGVYGSTSCCVSHGPSQWERAIFDPPQLRDPLTDFHEA